MTFRDRRHINRRYCQRSVARALMMTMAETILGVRDQAATGQDKWVLHGRYPGVTNGFFVELGAADGALNSNTHPKSSGMSAVRRA